MTTLRVVVDQIVARVPGGVGRYAHELTQQLIATSPAGCEVEGIVAAHPAADYERLESMLPGLARLYKAPIGRRELSRAWQYGIALPLGGGLIHAPSLFAPLVKHDRRLDGNQIAVTIHDVVPWTHPETLTPHGVAWHKALTKRARKHADTIVVPTHAVAQQLAERYDFGDRIRVIGGAVSSSLSIGADADERAARLELPDEYLLTVGTLEPRKGLASLIAGLATSGAPDLPLLIVGPAGWGDLDVLAVAEEEGLAADRVRVLGFLSDADLAVALSRASVFVYPSVAEGFGLPIIEAFSFGIPVVHSDDPAVLEVSAGSGIAVERSNAKEYPERLVEAISKALSDRELSTRMRQLGLDRSRAFSWRDSAERVWQLHADL